MDRKGDGTGGVINVEHAAVSLTGGIQPEILKRALGAQHFENGLAARILLAYPPWEPAEWTDNDVSAESLQRISILYDQLLALEFTTDEDGRSIPLDLPLTPSGKKAFVEFHDQHAKEQVKLKGALAAAYSKLKGCAARLALWTHLVRAVSKDASLEKANAIDAQSVKVGVSLARWFGNEAERVYIALGVTTARKDEDHLVALIRRNGGRISVRELMQQRRKYRSNATLSRAELNLLVERGQGEWLEDGRLFSLTETPAAKILPLRAPESGNSGNSGNSQVADSQTPGNSGNGNTEPPDDDFHFGLSDDGAML